MTQLRYLTFMVSAIAGTSLRFAQGKDVSMHKTDPDLVLKLVAKTETYKVPAEWCGEKLKEKIAAERAFPKPPAVDLELQITNKGAAEKNLRLDSDAGRLILDLKGPVRSAPTLAESSRKNIAVEKL